MRFLGYVIHKKRWTIDYTICNRLSTKYQVVLVKNTNSLVVDTSTNDVKKFVGNSLLSALVVLEIQSA